MKTHPILFSGPMVRALLNGSKTQTRRVVKPLSKNHPIVNLAIDGAQASMKNYSGEHGDPFSWGFAGAEEGGDCPLGSWNILCPHGQPGDLLWVRETIAYQWPDHCDDGRMYPDNEGADIREFGRPIKPHECDVIYAATELDAEWMGDDGEPCRPRWKPSIHMPRSASRITLEITGVRVERLRSISEADARSEGCWNNETIELASRAHYVPHDKVAPLTCWRALWESINGAQSWNDNPWVWVIEFKVHRCNVDELLTQRGAA